MNALLDGLKSLGAARLVAMAAVAAGMLGLLGMLMLRAPTEHMALLYADLDAREAGQVADLLERQRVPHQIGGGGTQILVPTDQVARMRLLLAKDGLPSGGSIGYELFDRGDSLTTSQFQQTLNQARALEGELARTIRGITGVRAARVHLVLPKREPFARERQDAQASVVLTMAGAGRMDREGVQAILNVVAAAVPGLRPQNIAIIDSRGNVLARAGNPTGTATVQTTEELRRGTELRVARAVEEMLERSLGPGRVRAEASVEMDFDQVRETQERFDPEGKVERSTQAVTSNSRTTEGANTVSVQNNLPNADAGNSQTGSQEQKQEETTNYEISKTVRTLVREQPQIRRISLAVLVDGAEERGPDGGPPGWRARTPDELERIARLVQSAIGFDEKRGDRVEIVNMRFATDGEVIAEPQGLFGLPIDRADLMKLANTALIGLIVLAAMLLVLRPMVVRLTAAIPALGGSGGAQSGGVVGADGLLVTADGSPGGSIAGMLPGQSGGDAMPDDDSLVKVANIEGQLRASSMRRLAELVDKHPDESLTIVRGWMQQERTT
jgi:flagellar M-ring protein FliF